ncbi:MAG: DUF2157 domain-containing protein, partial [Mesorhizobium sp.]
MASYSSRVRADIARWLQADLIDASTSSVSAPAVEASIRPA